MDKRKYTPDVLGNIMSGTIPLETKQFSLEKKGKEKVTFNLSVELLRQLEEVWMKMRKTSSKRKVSKTLIVETVLKQALCEMEMHQEKSALYIELIRESKDS